MGNASTAEIKQNLKKKKYKVITIESDKILGDYEVILFPKIDDKRFLKQSLNLSYYDRFADTEKFTQKLGKECKQLTNFFLAEENTENPEIIDFLFEYGTQFENPIIKEKHVWKTITQILDALIFLEDEMLHYPCLSRRFVLFQDKYKIKLLNPFAFPEFRQEALSVYLNPLISISKRKAHSLSQIIKNIHDFGLTIITLVAKCSEQALHSDPNYAIKIVDGLSLKFSKGLVSFLRMQLEIKSDIISFKQIRDQLLLIMSGKEVNIELSDLSESIPMNQLPLENKRQVQSLKTIPQTKDVSFKANPPEKIGTPENSNQKLVNGPNSQSVTQLIQTNPVINPLPVNRNIKMSESILLPVHVQVSSKGPQNPNLMTDLYKRNFKTLDFISQNNLDTKQSTNNPEQKIKSEPSLFLKPVPPKVIFVEQKLTSAENSPISNPSITNQKIDKINVSPFKIQNQHKPTLIPSTNNPVSSSLQNNPINSNKSDNFSVSLNTPDFFDLSQLYNNLSFPNVPSNFMLTPSHNTPSDMQIPPVQITLPNFQKINSGKNINTSNTSSKQNQNNLNTNFSCFPQPIIPSNNNIPQINQQLPKSNIFTDGQEFINIEPQDANDPTVIPFVRRDSKPSCDFLNTAQPNVTDMNSYFQIKSSGFHETIANVGASLIRRSSLTDSKSSETNHIKSIDSPLISPDSLNQPINKTEINDSKFQMLTASQLPSPNKLDTNEICSPPFQSASTKEIARFVYKWIPTEKKHKKVVEYTDGTSEEASLTDSEKEQFNLVSNLDQPVTQPLVTEITATEPQMRPSPIESEFSKNGSILPTENSILDKKSIMGIYEMPNQRSFPVLIPTVSCVNFILIPPDNSTPILLFRSNPTLRNAHFNAQRVIVDTNDPVQPSNYHFAEKIPKKVVSLTNLVTDANFIRKQDYLKVSTLENF